MKEETEDKHACYEEIRQKLLTLRVVLSTGGEGVKYPLAFDEFVREQEWGLALHTVCDYLLEPEIRVVAAVIEQIQTLHEIMGIEDTCVTDLRRKVARSI